MLRRLFFQSEKRLPRGTGVINKFLNGTLIKSIEALNLKKTFLIMFRNQNSMGSEIVGVGERVKSLQSC